MSQVESDEPGRTSGPTDGFTEVESTTGGTDLATIFREKLSRLTAGDRKPTDKELMGLLKDPETRKLLAETISDIRRGTGEVKP